MTKYSLPDLRYDYGALEPHISGRIMELHHDKHHAGYVKVCCLGRNVTDQPPCYAHGKENRHVEEANPTSFHV
jgi:superoxide dismutase